jgi:hypothetical protein
LTVQRTWTAAILIFSFAGVGASAAEVPAPIAAPGLTVVESVHGEGAQIYECKASPEGKMTWQFREPIASLFENGKTVGKHFAGPTWSMGGNTFKGKVAAKVGAANTGDVAWLKLDVVESSGEGPLTGVTTIQRIDTAGGNLAGSCDKAGSLRSVAYSADYVFLKK